MNSVIEYEELADALSRIGCLQGAAEVHGGICGALCVAAPEEFNLRLVLDPSDDQEFQSHAPAEATLTAVCEQAAESLEDRSMGFAPVLPDDEDPLDLRVRALISWCEGFLYGLSCQSNLDLEACTEATREIVADLTEFTRASLAEDEDGETEEAAYVELLEYVRVGVQIIYIELKSRPSAEDGEAQTLH